MSYLCDLTRGVGVAIFSFQFHVFYFLVGYRLTISKHENQIVFHTVKQEVTIRGKKTTISEKIKPIFSAKKKWIMTFILYVRLVKSLYIEV